ncbi:3-oxoacyl-ACP synthase III family protein [Saccharopolyspora phatthalungensis]|uniref:3-oxoacyl-[acyl-carrier-protein] synthase-3 n=1 Tax=Saccharopolyspora phatthalungensis TaxID=664693 RepID=A0A840QKV0_9PSEU|nr:3-oxoacyl-[acyl-carrier-protein] synthase III C-terminal domain-containing protein [Saccharopolyspora phatthalungensis]MBB5159513.1 3-oxoacyl-[acyl-carrier-protein] synthase-3 [Saccharopolyspora phatthalungensis]
MKQISLLDVSSYLPKNRIPVEYFTRYAESDEQAGSVMFKAPSYRHHIAPDETAADMAERAVAALVERHGSAAIRSVDAIVTNTMLLDVPIYGCGGELAHRVGANPEWVIDLHNATCVSFVYMLKVARQLLQAEQATSALVCNVANMGGQMFVQPQVRKLSQAAIPGDGAAVALLTASADSPILHVETLVNSDLAGHMKLGCTDGRKYWQPGTGELHFQFTDASVKEVLHHGNRVVPEVVRRACRRIGAHTTDIDVLVTNQPNRTFLSNWREELGLPPERHPDTFDDCGNMFGAGIPVTLDRAIQDGTIPGGSLLMLAGFAHTGDFAAAAAVRWRP